MLLLQDLFSRNGTKYMLRLQQLELLAVVSPNLTFMCKHKRICDFETGFSKWEINKCALCLLLSLLAVCLENDLLFKILQYIL